MPHWYKNKYVCLKKGCEAIHWYKARKCSRCGYWLLGRRDNKVEEIKLRLEINELKLEQEIKIQANQVRVWSERVAELQAIYDRAKSDLEITDAELHIQIGRNPEAYDLEKSTRDMVSAAVTIHPEHRMKLVKLQKSKVELDSAKAVVSALQDRKRSLTLLTELYVHQYYNEKAVEFTEPLDEDGKRRVRSSARRRRLEKEEEDRELD